MPLPVEQGTLKHKKGKAMWESSADLCRDQGPSMLPDVELLAVNQHTVII